MLPLPPSSSRTDAHLPYTTLFRSIDNVHVDARGAVERLQLQANAGSEFGNLALSGSTARRNGRWQGTLASLQLEPSRGSAWSLPDPATFAQTGNSWSLDSTCLTATDGGTLCANGAWPQGGRAVECSGIPPPIATPCLPDRTDRRRRPGHRKNEHT